MEFETVEERQSRVVRAGERWEEYVRLYLSEKLEETRISVIPGKSEQGIKARSPALWKALSLPLKSSHLQESIWGDIDLIAHKDEIPIVVISCKLSLHGRFTETLFWSLLFRTLTRIRVVLATPDAGRGNKNKWVSEWGTPTEPSKDRLLAESYLHGVYVENLPEFCQRIKPGEGTTIGGIVRPLSELPEDTQKWGDEIAKFLK